MAKREWARIAAVIALLLVINRGLMFFTAFLGKNLFCKYIGLPSYREEELWGRLCPRLVLPESLRETSPITLEDLHKFDSCWYWGIIQRGYDRYRMSEEHPAANWVFLPFYPLCVKALSALFPFLDGRLVGIIFSNGCFYLALIFLYLFIREWRQEEGGLKALWLLMLYPASLYFSLLYTESLFLLLSVLTFYCTLRGRYFPALIFASLSSITRIPGFLNIAFMLIFMIYQERQNLGPRLWARAIVYGFLAGLPLLAYCLYLKSITGDFWAVFHEELNWGRTTTFPLLTYILYLKDPYFLSPHGGWDNGPISFIMTTAVFGGYLGGFFRKTKLKKLNGGEAILFAYGLSSLLLSHATAGSDMTSMVRYMMSAWPVFLYLEDLVRNNPPLEFFYLSLFWGLNVIYVIAFINNYFFVV
ncbi:MAG TPA: hypothetical protein ENM97_03720 [Moorella mulderi]|nr:hypothetical protein [Moorella mulderi]